MAYMPNGKPSNRPPSTTTTETGLQKITKAKLYGGMK